MQVWEKRMLNEPLIQMPYYTFQNVLKCIPETYKINYCIQNEALSDIYKIALHLFHSDFVNRMVYFQHECESCICDI